MGYCGMSKAAGFELMKFTVVGFEVAQEVVVEAEGGDR